MNRSADFVKHLAPALRARTRCLTGHRTRSFRLRLPDRRTAPVSTAIGRSPCENNLVTEINGGEGGFMSSDKKSMLQRAGWPDQICLVLFTLALVLTLSPYLGGVDFGGIKVPKLPTQVTRVMYFLGPMLLLASLLLFIPFRWQDKSLLITTEDKARTVIKKILNINNKYSGSS